MTISEQPEEETIHQIFLAYHNVTDLLAEPRNPLAQLPNFLRNFLRRFHTVSSDTRARENVRSNVSQLADFLLISLANPMLPPGLRGRAQAQNDAKRWIAMFVLKPWHRAIWIAVFASIAVSALIWFAWQDPAINFLPRDSRAEWIVLPTAADPHAHWFANLDATFRLEFVLTNQ